MDVKEFTKKA